MTQRFFTWAPWVALVLLGLAWFAGASGWMAALSALALVAAVFAAVHHAEVIAEHVGEPMGTLVLAVAVTVIEVALIVSMMLTQGAAASTLPRDTVYAAVMIIGTGVVGGCLLLGGMRHRVQRFRTEGINAGLATVTTMAVLTMVLPSYTLTTPGPTYSTAQLIFVAIASVVLWAAFVGFQTGHREYFLHQPVDAADLLGRDAAPGAAGSGRDAPALHASSSRHAWVSAGLLVVSLVGVVGLAKVLSPALEAMLKSLGAPPAVLGIVIALIVLTPETVAAVRAARADRLQTSLNLAWGSALASIGLTIPAVIMASFWLGMPLALGLDAKHALLLALTVIVSSITMGFGTSTAVLGVVHLVIFATFLLFAWVP